MNTDTDRRPSKHGIKTGYNADDGVNGTSSGPTSQIPGLSQDANNGPEERSRGRRVGVMDSDSVYVKLAKQGGQKGLLWHEETNLESKPNPAYQAPDWFAEGSQNQEAVSLHNALSSFSPTENEKTVRTPDAPFGSDNKSTWEREADREKKCGDPASSQMEKLALTEEEQHDASKFKKTAQNKKPEAVSMSKLLSFGYVENEPSGVSASDVSQN
ncbi:uncharacterized protein C7orf57-like isoform X1 [Hypomesus transpacificus]|uniref:uncharacterized protein C7orf57-like isoform X1 n=1 Tax=Hypomesus transpacificus TaxID=137520 RepID=UPI001F080BD4|nr:uncharacterized protein C7orf57-like isoform X1 [Hypomesus transpacificus]